MFKRFAAQPAVRAFSDLVVKAPSVRQQVHDMKVLVNVAARRSEAGIAYARQLDTDAGRLAWRGVTELLDTSRELKPGVTVGHVLTRAEEIAREGFETVHHALRRPRPFWLNHALPTEVERPNLWSMPSFHTMIAYINGGVVANIEPHAARAAERLAMDSALARVYGGVHHPSDTVAAARIANRAVQQALSEVGIAAQPLKLPPVNLQRVYKTFGAVDNLTELRSTLTRTPGTGAGGVSA